MILHCLREAPSPELATALEQFEEQFTYPLGAGRSFRISHGEDYPRFFRAMGQAACFVAQRDGRVLAVIGAAIRELIQPGGRRLAALYLGDLKIAPWARDGHSLVRLMEGVESWVDGRAVAAFGVVMEGTPLTPDRYTGRVGIPPFEKLGRIMVLRLPTLPPISSDAAWIAPAERGQARFLELTAGAFTCPNAWPDERSEIKPIWLMSPDGEAVGRIEDTRRAKRLIADDGMEMRCAHLSCFAHSDPPRGIELLNVARRMAGGLGFPAIFVAVRVDEAPAICAALACDDIIKAPAAVYGAGLRPGGTWNINTAEI